MTTIAIDGPGGSGKSTLARGLAKRLSLDWLDTGAMYRAVTLAAIEAGVDPSDGALLGSLAASLLIEVGERVRLDGIDVTAAIRSPAVDALVSQVAAHGEVRAVLVERQRAWVLAHGGGIVEGRDITSVVLPGADLKLYLTAGNDERSKRRAHEREGADLEATRAAIERRDATDGSRAISPLVIVEDAVVLDSSDRSAGSMLEAVLELLADAGLTSAPTTAPARAQAAEDAAEATPARSARAARASRRAEAEGGAPTPSRSALGPPGRGELAFYTICRAISVGASHLWYPGPVVGSERLPRTGSYILAPVHRTNLDWLIAARVTRRRLRYIVKGEVWRSRFAGRLLEMLGAFPVDRGVADREALNVALSVLEAGEPLVVFPEGTRGTGERIGELRDGTAYLALRARAPIYPVGLGRLEASMPRGTKVPRPLRTRIVVGEPIDPAAFVEAARAGANHLEVPAPGSSRVPRVLTKALSGEIRAGLQRVHDLAEGG